MNDQPAPTTFGQRYKQILKQRGMTMRDVDHKMLEVFGEGLSPDTQKNWDKRGVLPRYQLSIYRACRILNVSPDYLYGFTDTPDPVGELGLDPAAGAAPPSGERRRVERRRRRGRAS